MQRILLLFLVTFSGTAFSQSAKDIPIGTWRYESPCHSFSTLAIANDIIYAGSEQAFLAFNKTDNSLKVLSKADGFSDVSIAKIAYSPQNNTTIIAYSNGNLDLLKDGSILNIPDIKNKSFPGSKRINDIKFYKNYAYLATDFGLVKLDLDKEEITETARDIGTEGKGLKVIGVALKGDSVFLATSTGVMAANIHSNLLNFDNWRSYEISDGIPTTNLTGIVAFQDKIYTSVTAYIQKDSIISDSSGLYSYNGNKWIKELAIKNKIFGLDYSEGKLLINTLGKVLIYKDAVIQHIDLYVFEEPFESKIDKDGTIWIADTQLGLMAYSNGKLRNYKPNSPYFNETFKLAYMPGKIINLYGGYHSSTTNFFRTKGFDILSDGLWTNYSWDQKTLPQTYDFIDALYNPFDDLTYFTSWGYGVCIFDEDSIHNWIMGYNSPLQSLIPGSPYIRVGGISVDSSGNLWLASSVTDASHPLLNYRKPDNTWESYYFDFPGEQNPFSLDIDFNGNKWLRFRPSSSKGLSFSLVVFNENLKQGKQYRVISTGTGYGGLPNADVFACTVDKSGDIWVGTQKGIAILKKSEDPFTTDFTLPYYDGFPLLMDKKINAIEVDGGNRKWVGTNDGLWLFNDDGTEVIYFFDETNSPLPSSDIKDIEIQEETGEVFIATSKGLVSFRGTATEGNPSTFSNVKVFPNPVRENFTGLIGISGLAMDASVKITDVFGNLVYETKAEGGTAVWNGKNYNGERAKSGVYLIFSATKDAKEGMVAKVAIIE